MHAAVTVHRVGGTCGGGRGEGGIERRQVGDISKGVRTFIRAPSVEGPDRVGSSAGSCHQVERFGVVLPGPLRSGT
jgi:hypothetical protein